MNQLNRAVHIDFHTLPGIDRICEDFDAKEFSQTLKNANVTYINMFARCNIGFSYYDTKVGTKYPGLKGNMLADVIEECHKNEIGVTAYLNIGLNHELCFKHPEYMVIKKDGSVYELGDAKRSFFRQPCYNTGYREHTLSEIDEIVKLNPDGIFCDSAFTHNCYCPRCIERMKNEGVDFNDDEQVTKFASKVRLEFLEQIRERVPQNIRLYFNGPYHLFPQLYSHSEIECLPTHNDWGYEYFASYAPYYRHFGGDKLYMTGRFVDTWGDFGGVRTNAALENDMYDAFMQGYGISIGDHLHPHGKLDEELYQNIGKMFAYAKSVEKWTSNSEVLTDVCILRNNAAIKPDDSARGACRMLAELKISYDIRDENMDLSQYKLLVIPDNIQINEKFAQKLEKFDGAIISCGKSLSNDLKPWKHMQYCGEDASSQVYFKTQSGSVRSGYLASALIKSDYSVSPYINPYFNNIWDGRHGHRYIPPKGETEFSAVVKKDKYAHICFDIFRSYLSYGAVYLKDLIASLVDEFVPDRLILTNDLPSSARTSLLSYGDDRIFMVKATHPELRGSRGIIEEHTVLPKGRKVKIFGKFKNAVTLPEEELVEISICGDYTEITLPEINGFEMILLKTE